MTSLRALLEEAGFHGDALDTAVAVAMAESRGHADAHNTNVNTGDNSYGLFQINMLGGLGPARRAEFGLGSNDELFDPLTNAKIAFRMSHGGQDWSPWSTYKSGAYEAYLGPTVDTQITGAGTPVGTHDPLPGTGDTASGRGTDFDIPSGQPLMSMDVLAEHHAEELAYSLGYLPRPTEQQHPLGTPHGDPNALHTFLHAAVAQLGDSYVFGAKGTGESDPTQFDCSGLTAWAADQAGVQLPAGAAHQYVWLKQHGMLIPVDQAIHTPGALLFHFASEPQPGTGEPEVAHVAISLGNGKTIEAADPQDGVVEWDAGGGRFNYAAIIPGIGDLPAGGTGTGLPGVDTAGSPDSFAHPDDPLDPNTVWQDFYDKIGEHYGRLHHGHGHGVHVHEGVEADHHGHHGPVDFGDH